MPVMSGVPIRIAALGTGSHCGDHMDDSRECSEVSVRVQAVRRFRVRRAVAATTVTVAVAVTAAIDRRELVEVVLIRNCEVWVPSPPHSVHTSLVVPAVLVVETEPVPDLLTHHQLSSEGVIPDRALVLQEEVVQQGLGDDDLSGGG